MKTPLSLDDALAPRSAPQGVDGAGDAAGARGLGLRDEHRWLLGLLLVALVVRVVTLAAYPLMDNTEARYAEVARKMVETSDWITPQFKYGVPFWSKPPLSIWLIAASYVALGINEFTARLPSLLACLPVAWLTYDLAARRGGKTLGLRAAVVLASTPLFFITAGAVMTDPALVLATTLSMAGFWYAMTDEGRGASLWGYAFFVGLAIGLLAKGPVGAVLTLAPVGVWTLWKGGVRNVWQRLPWITGTVLMIAIAVPWYVLAERRTPGFLEYFLVGEHWKRFTESGWKGDMFGTAHVRPRGTIWLFAAASTLPWSIAWAAQALKLRRARSARASTALEPKSARNDGWREYLWLWMLASPLFFTFAGNILFTYVLPGLPAFALLVAATGTAAEDGAATRVSTTVNALIVPLLMVIAIVLVLPRIGQQSSHKELVAAYAVARSGDAQRLVYLHEAPQSAEFYARGKVKTAATDAELQGYLADSERDFLALTDAQLDALPQLRGRLTPIGHYGRYTLFQEKR